MSAVRLIEACPKRSETTLSDSPASSSKVVPSRSHSMDFAMDLLQKSPPGIGPRRAKLLCYIDSGGGTRTPDTRIMIFVSRVGPSVG